MKDGEKRMKEGRKEGRKKNVWKFPDQA